MTMSNRELGRPVDILVIEDNPADARLTQEVLKEAKIPNNMHVARDGVEALAFLHREGKYSQAPRPDLILLDLNLPRKDGREVLAEIKADKDLGTIPVVVLSISRAEEDILLCYKLNANCYTTKPMDLLQFNNMVRSITQFWFSTVTLPPRVKA